MIRILKETPNFNITDEQIQSKYDEQFERVKRLVNIQIDIMIENISKMKDTMTKYIMKDYIGSAYFDKYGNFIINSDSDDVEDRNEEIKYLDKLESQSDDTLLSEIEDELKRIIVDD